MASTGNPKNQNPDGLGNLAQIIADQSNHLEDELACDGCGRFHSTGFSVNGLIFCPLCINAACEDF